MKQYPLLSTYSSYADPVYLVTWLGTKHVINELSFYR